MPRRLCASYVGHGSGRVLLEHARAAAAHPRHPRRRFRLSPGKPPLPSLLLGASSSSPSPSARHPLASPCLPTTAPPPAPPSSSPCPSPSICLGLVNLPRSRRWAGGGRGPHVLHQDRLPAGRHARPTDHLRLQGTRIPACPPILVCHPRQCLVALHLVPSDLALSAPPLPRDLTA